MLGRRPNIPIPQLNSSSKISVYDPSLSHAPKRPAPEPVEHFPDAWDSKRVKPGLEGNEDAPPSRVLFIRQLPLDVTEAELADLAIPFGAISNMVLTRNSGFGLIEMLHQSAAEDMVDYYTRVYQPAIRGKGPISVAFSRYNTLTTTPPNQFVSEAIIGANKQFATSTALDLGSRPRTVIKTEAHRLPPGTHVDHRQFHEIFSRFGRILRIITFRSGHVPAALIEFDDPIAAHVALLSTDDRPFTLHQLHGAPSCRLDTVFSTQKMIGDYSNGAPNRDYPPRSERMDNGRDTGLGRDRPYSPGVYDQDRPREPEQRYVASSPDDHNRYRHPNHVVDSLPSRSGPGMFSRGDRLLEELTEEHLSRLDVDVLSELAARMVKPLLRAALQAGGQRASFFRAQAEVLDNLVPRVPVHPGPAQPRPLMSMNLAMGGNTGQGQSSANSSAREDADAKTSPVVYVTGLNSKAFTPDKLFILFGVYGDVIRVKMLHNKRDCALVEYKDPLQAQRAVKHLDRLNVFEKPIHCIVSRNKTISINAPGPKDSAATAESIKELNREYFKHPLHRFTHGAPRMEKHYTAPLKTLHFTNLPKEITDEDLIDLISTECGHKVVKVKLVKGKKVAAFVELENKEKATETLIKLHDHEIIEGHRIRINFSKTIINL